MAGVKVLYFLPRQLWGRQLLIMYSDEWTCDAVLTDWEVEFHGFVFVPFPVTCTWLSKGKTGQSDR